MSNWMQGAAAAVQGITGIVSGAMNNHAMQQTNQQEQNTNWEMYHYNNIYNDPLLQRTRLERAGYNPNSIFGHGDLANTAKAPTPPQLRTPNYSGMADGVSSAISNYYNFRMQDQQRELMEKEEMLKEAQTAGQIVKNTGEAIKNASGQIDLDKKKSIFNYQVDYQFHLLDKLKKDSLGSDLRNYNQSLKNVEQQLVNKYKDQSLQNAIIKSTVEIQSLEQSVKESISRISVNNQNISESQSRELINQFIAQIREVDASMRAKGFTADAQDWTTILKGVFDGSSTSNVGVSILTQLLKLVPTVILKR